MQIRRANPAGRHLPERRLHSVQGLLHTSDLFEEAGHGFAEQGIEVARRRSTWRR
jgi:hypothetical protein